MCEGSRLVDERYSTGNNDDFLLKAFKYKLIGWYSSFWLNEHLHYAQLIDLLAIKRLYIVARNAMSPSQSSVQFVFVEFWRLNFMLLLTHKRGIRCPNVVQCLDQEITSGCKSKCCQGFLAALLVYFNTRFKTLTTSVYYDMIRLGGASHFRTYFQGMD